MLLSARTGTDNEVHNNFCSMRKKLGDVIKQNCIDCHMPLKPSKAIAVQLHGDSIPIAALIRSHFIAIHPEETQKVLAVLKKLK